jgi:hypothetical protein
MWPFKKSQSSEPKPATGDRRPEVVLKDKTQVQTSRVVGLAAVFASGGIQLKGTGMDLLDDARNLYNAANPGFTGSISPSNFLIVINPSRDIDISTMVSAFVTNQQAQRFGRTSKVVQVGRMSVLSADHTAIKVPTALVTFVRIDQQEPETIEVIEKGIVEFINDKAKTVVEKGTGKEATANYTFGRGAQFAAVVFTQPGDSGVQFYFFENKDIADAMLPGMSAQIPGLIGSSVVQCTLEEIQIEATKCGASIEAYFMKGDSIIMRRY